MAPRRRTAKTKVAAAWRDFYETPEGRIAVGALMARFGVYAPFTGLDATSLALNVGERNVCAWIAEQIGHRPDQYVDQRSEVEKLTEKILEQYGA